MSDALPGERTFQIEYGDREGPARAWGSKDRAEIKVHICRSCHEHLNATSDYWASHELPTLISNGTSRAFEGDELRRIAHWCVRTAATCQVKLPADG